VEFEDLDDSAPIISLPGGPVVQLTVFLENRVGALLSIVRMINELRVEVLGMSMVDSVDVTIVRLIVTDPEAVSARFMERGIPFSESQMVVIELKSGAQSLAGCLAVLLEVETNIHFTYPLMSRPDGKSAIAMNVEDPDFSAAALTKAGFRTLFQEDLSR
jgi:hypothetical protein